MKKTFCFTLAILTAAVFFGCATQAPQGSPGGAIDMTGTWLLQVETPSGSGSPTFELKQAGNDLSGTYTGAFGSAPVTGTVAGDTFQIQFESMGTNITYNGTVTGNTVKGDVDFGGQGSGTFKGRR
jgi:hypothetical protein